MRCGGFARRAWITSICRCCGQVQQWRSAGHRVVLGTVTRTWGSAPRPVGSLVAVRDDGRRAQIAGSVSGGCIEDDLIDKVRAGALAADRAADRALRHRRRGGARASGCRAAARSSSCSSRSARHRASTSCSSALSQGERVRARARPRQTGAVTLEPPGDADELELDEHDARHHPRPALAPADDRRRADDAATWRRWRWRSTTRSSSATRARSTRVGFDVRRRAAARADARRHGGRAAGPTATPRSSR